MADPPVFHMYHYSKQSFEDVVLKWLRGVACTNGTYGAESVLRDAYYDAWASQVGGTGIAVLVNVIVCRHLSPHKPLARGCSRPQPPLSCRSRHTASLPSWFLP
jgi:hypothetical protein